MPRPALTLISLTITTAHPLAADAADALRRDLTQAARWYGIAPEVEPDYALARGAVLFGRDGNRITWAREDVDVATVRAVGDALARTWRRVVRNHCGDAAVIEFDGLEIAAPVEQSNIKREAA